MTPTIEAIRSVCIVAAIVLLSKGIAMLVISRKIGERFQIGPDVWVRINAIKGRDVVIGIEAPREISIRREDAGVKENKQSGGDAGKTN